MIRRSIREWDRLDVGPGAGAISRTSANQLLAIARKAQKNLRVSGPDSDAVLNDRGNALHAGQVVGVLAAPTISLEILPKVDGLNDGATRVNLVRMLARTIDLRLANGELAELGLQRFDLLEILIRLFCGKLFILVHRGLPRRYVNLEDELHALRGRLDLKRQFTKLAASPQLLACRYEELSVDISINQILKAAVQRLRSISRAPENQRRLIELELAFASVATIPANDLPFQSVVLDRTNSDWHDVLRLAQLLLGNRFQTTSMGNDRGFSLLFEMNTLFEKFLGRVVQRSLRERSLSVTLQGPHSFALCELNSDVRRFMTKPDIVIHSAEKPVMIIDTKWKRLRGSIDDPRQGISQVDVYQMMAYGQIYDVERLMLLYPHHRELDPIGVQNTHLIVGSPRGQLRAATVDLSKFETIDAQLAALCESYLPSETTVSPSKITDRESCFVVPK